ncbi:hypothetical protein U1Q18_027520, partial [Sarracenia purpurea var. burkii]
LTTTRLGVRGEVKSHLGHHQDDEVGCSRPDWEAVENATCSRDDVVKVASWIWD